VHFGTAEDQAEDRAEVMEELRQRAQIRVDRVRALGLGAVLVNDDESDPVILGDEAEAVVREICRLRGMEGGERVRFVPGWRMSAAPFQSRRATHTHDAHPVYRGHRDTGYRISHGGKRAGRSGTRIGRRPILRFSDPLVRVALGDLRPVQGQLICPRVRIWCPMCGTRNDVDWPEALRGCEAS
jgi:hypothetical protein